jgi:hypothetical protein
MNPVETLVQKVARDVDLSRSSQFHRYVLFAERVFAVLKSEVVEQELLDHVDRRSMDLIQATLDVAERTIIRGK